MTKEPSTNPRPRTIDPTTQGLYARLCRVLDRQGELLTLKGDHQRALSIDLRLAQLRPHDCIVRYNLACSLALHGKSDEAIVQLREAMQREMLALLREARATCLMVTHNPDEAMRLGDRIAVMRDGRIVQVQRKVRIRR